MDVLDSLKQQVSEAQRVLDNRDQLLATVEGVRLLQVAEEAASGLPGDPVTDDETFRTVVALRDELGGCLLAARQLREAGVANEVIVGILRRGAAAAGVILGSDGGVGRAPGAVTRPRPRATAPAGAG